VNARAESKPQALIFCCVAVVVVRENLFVEITRLAGTLSHAASHTPQRLFYVKVRSH
jgi:hypothetical protein